MFIDINKISVLLNIYICLSWASSGARGSTYQTDKKSKCIVNIDGRMLEKTVGEVWNSPNDLCLKHTCEIAPNGIAVESTFQEYCYHKCNNDYDLVPKKGQCCGECIRKRCTFNNQTYEVGDMWKSKDKCRFYECAGNQLDDNIVEAKVISYQKACPKLDNCPTNQIYMKDCCSYCQMDQQRTDQSNLSDFVHAPDKHNAIMSQDTYRQHPCRRECIKGDAPKTCNYTFVLEWYETLSKACFDCPYNETDCSRPHCVYADGFRRSVLLVNRMMPGPAIEVCKGDTLVVDVENNLMGESTSIHWHGLHQRDTPFYDGVPQITQCPISPHTSFRYTVKATNAGTHWWHSHVGMQRADGAFGALIIREPKIDLPESIRNTYDYDTVDHVIIMQDWDHKTGVSGFNSFHHSIGNNKPKNILINGKGRYFAPDLEREIQTIKPITATTTTTASVPEQQPEILEQHPEIVEQQPNLLEQLPEEVTETAEEFVQRNAKYSVLGNRRKRATDNVRADIESYHTPYEVFNVKKGSKYRFRTINSGFLNCPLEISVDNHTLLIIASDGHYFEPVAVDSFVSYAGERFDFVVIADRPIGNYWIRVKGLMDCDERFLKAHQGAILRYDGAVDQIPDEELKYDFRRGGFQLNSLNRGTGHLDSVSMAELTSLEPDNPALLTEFTDYQFYVYYDFYDKDFPHFNNPSLYSIQAVSHESDKFFGPQLNHISMKMPSTPFLIGREQNDESKYCNSSSLSEMDINCRKDFCECTHVLQVPLNSTVEIVLVDEGYKYDANHPFHLHGHDFRVVAMERIQPTGVNVEQIKRLDESNGIKRRLSGAPIKDTITVPDGGYTIIRFVANNPGFWLFHCHIEFHVEVGMALVFKVGDYNQMPNVPENFPRCSNFMPTTQTNNSALQASDEPYSFSSASNKSPYGILLIAILVLSK